jgi:outer membrane protein
MRRLTLVAFLLVTGLTGPGLEAQTELRIAFINSEAIIQEAPGAREAQDQFDRDMARFRSEVQLMGDELQTLAASYEQQQLTLSPEVRQSREDQIRVKQTEYQARIQQLETQAGARQAELVEPVMERITEVIEQIRNEGSYSIIFDVAAGAIISADPALDLTEEVIRRLRNAAAAGGG